MELKRIAMNNVEFYIYEDQLWCMFPDGRNEQVTEHSNELIKDTLDKIKTFYPDAYNDLMKWYKKSSANISYFHFLMVNRFCKCNFGKLDTKDHDIDFDGSFHFERVDCPLRGECIHECIVCNPKFNSRLSDSELRVMKLFYEGLQIDEIADKLYLSPHTVKNHIKAVYHRLGIHEKAEFFQYVNKHNLFK